VIVGAGWPYQVSPRGRRAKFPIARRFPTEGGRPVAETWMLAAKAAPELRYMWMQYSARRSVQAKQGVTYGETEGKRKAASYMDKRQPGFVRQYHAKPRPATVVDPPWKTHWGMTCDNGQNDCVPYADWVHRGTRR